MNSTRPGSPLLAALLLALVGSSRAQTPPQDGANHLGGTSWQLVKFENSDDYEFDPANPEAVAAGMLKGTATSRERMALPPNAVFEATLEDVSRANAPAKIIAQTRIEHPGNPPIPFEIPYDPSRIKPWHRYAVRARVLVDGKLFFTTGRRYRVFTTGQSNEVALLLRRVGASSPVGGSAGTSASQPATGGAATTALENTYWKLTRLGDTPIRMAPQQREPHLVLNSESHRVNGWGGCNRLMGNYELHGDRLTFNQMVGTMMACVEGMATEKAFLDDLKQVNRWKITGQQLELFDSTGSQLASFEARHLK
jgi:putative lipoprotein